MDNLVVRVAEIVDSETCAEMSSKARELLNQLIEESKNKKERLIKLFVYGYPNYILVPLIKIQETETQEIFIKKGDEERW